MNGDPLLALFTQIRKCVPSGSRSCGHSGPADCLSAIDTEFCRTFNVTHANDAGMDDAGSRLVGTRDRLTELIGDREDS